jgi:predicted flap endonuclease-1-like 5' DNA nuclease
LEAADKASTSTESLDAGEFAEKDIEEAAARITDLLSTPTFGTFAQLAAMLNFKLALEAVPDDGRQRLLIKGNLIPKADLTLIEGIGPKISQLLYSSGILSFSQLASIKLKDLRKILDEADLKFIDPTTWPEQAKLAAAGDWETLHTLQDELKGGKRVDAQESARKAALQISDIWHSAKFTSFAQLLGALKFDLGLKYIPDDGKQTIQVEGPLILNDDLTRIEGIGPKIARLLQEAGIVSFTQLASTDAKDLQKILAKAKLKYIDPATWPEQATLAARGDWEALDALQEILKGGRRV